MLRTISRSISCYCIIFYLAVGAAAVHAADIDPRILAISRPEASGTFTQKRLFKGMSKPLISKGDFAYAQRKGLLWRTMAPIENELFADSRGVQTSLMGSTQTSSGKVEEKVTHLIFSLLAMDIEQLQKDFMLDTRWQGENWQLDLTPKSALIAAAIKSIAISGTSRLNYLQLTTQQGDVTEITFNGDTAPAAMAKLSAWLKR
ncbi:MAG TPA: outer membrane lipoprotein carrier protein LolA [Cellvibrionaceae bacterium]